MQMNGSDTQNEQARDGIISDGTNILNDMKSNDPAPENTERNAPEPHSDEPTPPEPKSRKKQKKPKFSGDYYYIGSSAEALAKLSFIRTLCSVGGLFLQAVVLLFLPQTGLKYVTINIPPYAYVYMWIVFVMLAASIYIIIMNFTRYKLAKRIPKERAPRKGFKRRVFLGLEIYIAVYALLLALEISFVCIQFDVYGMIAVILCAAALAAAVAARQITHIALKDAEFIPHCE